MLYYEHKKGGLSIMAYNFSEPIQQEHKLTLDNRGKLVVSGVEDVESFDEQAVVLVTVRGVLIIRGSGLHLQSLDLQGGAVCVDGVIDSLVYEQVRQSGSLLRRLFH